MLVRQRNTGLILTILLAVAVAASAALWLLRDVLPGSQSTFLPGTQLGGVDVSGLTAREAEDSLRQALEDYTLTVTFADGQETFSAEELGLTLSGARGLRALLRDQAILALFPNGGETGAELLSCPADSLTERVEQLPELTSRAGRTTEDACLRLDREHARFWLRAAKVGGTIDPSALAEAMSEAAQNLQPELNTISAGLYDGKAIRVRDSEELQTALKQAEQTLNLAISYRYQAPRAGIDETVEIDRQQLAQFLRVEEDGKTVAVRGKQLREYVRKMGQSYSAYPEGPAQFVTSLGTFVEVDAPATEIKVDEDALYEDLKSAIYNGESGPRTAPYEKGPQGVPGAASLGKTYVEVDLEHQHLYLYQDGKLAAQGDICSGSVVDGNATPEGLYTIDDIDHERYLRGTDYQEWVNTFMPYDGGYGLHDSTWREKGDYGGDVYLLSGSHGCINMPLELAQQVDEAVSVGTYVILYNSGTAKEDWDGQAIYGTSSYVRELADGGFTLDSYTEGNGELSYQSSDSDVVTVSEDGWVTPVGTGKATVTVTAAATEDQAAGEKHIVIVVTDPE